MTVRPALAALGVAVLAATVGTGAALAAGEYSGSARGVALTSNEAGYKALLQSVPAAKPTADKRKGYRTGWHAAYLSGTVAKPLQAIAVVYVYRTAADARRAWNRSCGPCETGVVTQGIRMKYQLRTAGDERTLIDVAVCRNVYLALVVSGELAPDELARRAGEFAGRVYRKAAARGMTPCQNG